MSPSVGQIVLNWSRIFTSGTIWSKAKSWLWRHLLIKFWIKSIALNLIVKNLTMALLQESVKKDVYPRVILKRLCESLTNPYQCTECPQRFHKLYEELCFRRKALCFPKKAYDRLRRWLWRLVPLGMRWNSPGTQWKSGLDMSKMY